MLGLECPSNVCFQDPKEYKPYLEGLQQKSELSRKHHIDDDLGRHTKALGHLHAMGDTAAAIAYTEKHVLYTEALELYKYDRANHAAVLRSFANFLNRKSKHAEAAVGMFNPQPKILLLVVEPNICLAFESLLDYAAASQAYRAANMWQECLSTFQAAYPDDPTLLKPLALSLAESLEEAKDHQAAAHVYVDYLSDEENAVRNFCHGYYFAEAIRVAMMRRKPQLVEDIIDPGLGEGFATLTELLSNCRLQLSEQVPRIKKLRSIKTHDPRTLSHSQ